MSGHWFAVVGIDKAVPLAPSLDRAVFIGAPGATALYGLADRPSTVYVRTKSAVRAALHRCSPGRRTLWSPAPSP